MMLAAEAIPGTHPTVSICGNAFLCTFNYDTLISSGLAIVVTLGIGFAVAFTLRRGTPHKLQMIFELILGYIRSLTRDTIGEENPPAFILPAFTTHPAPANSLSARST